ncbi:hypothetical protein ADL28_22395 [Streptomyces violaceusniger]|uniref:Lipoprotein n=2 Tax=Streptomyces violaceusniger group TaxID=2839105 RepID=A0ABD5J7T7_9ACTN|nr:MULTISPECIES: hypothetical protein [Streptomyces]MEE4584437.1 hypothetical protein [Streptomyces sp. DSM 41602]WTA79742.1 hypothetical protein OG751_06965 [Streptomyces antimycoticus]AJZ84773.1 hypothetical protein AS97_24780 [Streptomyces sp. AgN23]KUL55754.1 hypothetical protein ADL28_22395 [Streptomyces violaceusniger]RSS32481.1 hypothetical protein EF902_46180 [Streptomyces sp. WAC05858]
MSGRRTRTICAVSLMAVLAPTAVGCSDDGGTPSSEVSRASAAIASARSSAQAELDKIKGGSQAKREVRAGRATRDGAGRAVAPLTVTNGGKHTANYAIEVNFRNAGGDLVDAVVLHLSKVPPHRPTKATARSHRKLTGRITAQVGTAVRY